MLNSFSNEISKQQEKLRKGAPEFQLVKPCKIGDGILKLDSLSLNSDSKITWFIPASGSGSRMFQFLYDFLETKNQEHTDFQKFIKNVKSFAFYNCLDIKVRNEIEEGQIQLSDFIQYLLFDFGLNLGKLPKGLVPFHIAEAQVLNAFQEQVLQGLKLAQKNIDFHFTIQKEFEQDIVRSLNEIKSLDSSIIQFSAQEKETDSIAFDPDFKPIIIGHDFLKRPSGHGALLQNLNRIESEFILIKNIDNIQHIERSEESTRQWKAIIFLLNQVKQELFEIWKSPDIPQLTDLNNRYQIFSEEQMNSILTDEDLKKLLNRPIRVCGMVKNSGQPGGGPFWVKRNGVVSKQIVEKAQISNLPDQQLILNDSSHFNPVMIAASVYDFNGIKFNLTEFVDEDSYFIVHKTHEGKAIQYIENPGLWNGSMANWNSVFVEIPTEAFSPVKTILDLIEPAHQSL